MKVMYSIFLEPYKNCRISWTVNSHLGISFGAVRPEVQPRRVGQLLFLHYCKWGQSLCQGLGCSSKTSQPNRLFNYPKWRNTCKADLQIEKCKNRAEPEKEPECNGQIAHDTSQNI